jgi:hypothetical protein
MFTNYVRVSSPKDLVLRAIAVTKTYDARMMSAGWKTVPKEQL